MRIAIARSWVLRARVIPGPLSAQQVEVSSRIRTPSLLVKRPLPPVATRDPAKCPGPPLSEVHPPLVAPPGIRVPVEPQLHLLAELAARRRVHRHATTEHDLQQRNPARGNPARRARAVVALLVRVAPRVRVELQERVHGRLQVRALALREKARHERELEEKRQPRAAEHGAQGEEQHRAGERLGPLRENRLLGGQQRKLARDARLVGGLCLAPVVAHRAVVAVVKSEQLELS